MVKNSLLHKLQTPSSLKHAWKDLNKSNISSRGLSTETINTFSQNLESNIGKIRKELRNKEYNFSESRAVVIKQGKPDGKTKRRPIRVQEIRDRLVQRAIANLIGPILNKKYQLNNEASFAYLRKKGIRKALVRMINLYNKKRPIVLEADIKSFFDNVNREKLLKEMVIPALPDDSINNLIETSLNQEIGNLHEINNDDWELFPDSGIPQGGGLSPMFANVYLHEFDKVMLKNRYGLIRYADDFIVMCKDLEEANNAYDDAVKLIENNLGLELHKLTDKQDSKTRIIKLTQKRFEFLGVRFDGKKLYPGKKTKNNIEQRIREITEFKSHKNLYDVLRELKFTLEGWIASYCHTQVEENLTKIEKIIAERLAVFAHKIEWLNKRDPLNKEQMNKTGIINLKDFLQTSRNNLSDSELEIFNLSN